MTFIVVWLNESGYRFYIKEIKFTTDGVDIHWVKDQDKAIRFSSPESVVLDKIMAMYFDEKYYFEYFGGNEK